MLKKTLLAAAAATLLGAAPARAASYTLTMYSWIVTPGASAAHSLAAVTIPGFSTLTDCANAFTAMYSGVDGTSKTDSGFVSVLHVTSGGCALVQ